MFKRTYELQSPTKRGSGHFRFGAWASQRSTGSSARPRPLRASSKKRSGFANSGLRYASPPHRQSSAGRREHEHLITRAELVEELSQLDVDQPTLVCCRCCHPRVHRCSRQVLPLYRPRRVSSLFWMEKVVLFVDMMQVYGLLWATALAWPWPRAWRDWSVWTTALNVDTVSLDQQSFLTLHTGGVIQVPRSVYGQTHGSLFAYWLAWLVTLAALPTTYVIGRWLLRRLSADWAQFRSHLWNTCLFLFIILYLPIQIALARALDCDHVGADGSWTVSVDPGTKCLATTHIVAMSLSIVALVGMNVFAYWLRGSIRQHVLYETAPLHDKYLRWKEAEYVHGLGTEWLESGLWVLSSFRRGHAFYHPSRMHLKTALVLLHVLLRDYKAVQIDLIFVVLLAWAAWETLVPSFRCGSTWVMSLMINWVMVVNAVGGSIRAHDMRTPINVDSNYLIAISSVNGLATLAVGVMGVVWATNSSIHWPFPSAATRTGRSLTLKEREARQQQLRQTSKIMPAAAVMPVAETIVHHRLVAEQQEMTWVSALLRAKVEMSQAQLGLPELVNTQQLEATVRQLREMWREARKARSVMGWSLVETMDEVAALAEVCRPVSYLPNDSLANMLPGLVARLRRRADRLALVAPHKRRIFLKLLAFRSWIGDRVFERVEVGLPRTASVRYYFNPFSVELTPPTTGAVSVMNPSELLRQMPAILRARPTGHPKVTTVAATKYKQAVELMRAVQRRWAELLLAYERGFNVQDPKMRTRLREPTEVAAWYAAARQINGIVRSIDDVDTSRLEPMPVTDSGVARGTATTSAEFATAPTPL